MIAIIIINNKKKNNKNDDSRYLENAVSSYAYGRVYMQLNMHTKIANVNSSTNVWRQFECSIPA